MSHSDGEKFVDRYASWTQGVAAANPLGEVKSWAVLPRFSRLRYQRGRNKIPTNA